MRNPSWPRSAAELIGSVALEAGRWPWANAAWTISAISRRPTAQRAAFIAQLEIAVQVRKPVFLHQRDAHGDFAAILQDYDGRLQGGVAHCFTGGEPELEAYLALGLYIGITGWACDERRGVELRRVVPRIPARSAAD